MPALVLLTWYLLFGGEVEGDGYILCCNVTSFQLSCGEVGFETNAARPVLESVSDLLSEVSTGDSTSMLNLSRTLLSGTGC